LSSRDSKQELVKQVLWLTEDWPPCGTGCQWRRKVPSRWQLRVRIPQHFVNVFCPCREFSYWRDYVLKHQHIASCHKG